MKPILILAAALLALPGAVRADTAAEQCERQARHVSNYHGGRIPEFQAGPFTVRISGTAAFGVSRSSGGATTTVSRISARDHLEEKRAGHYRTALDNCLTGR